MGPYRVIQDPPGTWSWVVDANGERTAKDSGPWRYAWEAQEYADDLNSKPAAQKAGQ